jgi:hypothetical protein
MKLDYNKRSELDAALSSAGIIGEAAEAILRETAENRHIWRVEQTVGAALEAAKERDLGYPGLDVRNRHLYLVADLVGVGGRDDCEGEATDRHPAFTHLGNGRKQATDGPAWMAALESAVNRTNGEEIRPQNVAQIRPRRWARSVLREGLRVSLGLKPWSKALECGVVFAPDPKEWATALNEIEAEIAGAGKLIAGAGKFSTAREVVARVKVLLGRPLGFDDLKTIIKKRQAEEFFCVELDEYLLKLNWENRKEVTVKEVLGAPLTLAQREISELATFLANRIR